MPHPCLFSSLVLELYTGNKPCPTPPFTFIPTPLACHIRKALPAASCGASCALPQQVVPVSQCFPCSTTSTTHVIVIISNGERSIAPLLSATVYTRSSTLLSHGLPSRLPPALPLSHGSQYQLTMLSLSLSMMMNALPLPLSCSLISHCPFYMPPRLPLSTCALHVVLLPPPPISTNLTLLSTTTTTTPPLLPSYSLIPPLSFLHATLPSSIRLHPVRCPPSPVPMALSTCEPPPLCALCTTLLPYLVCRSFICPFLPCSCNLQTIHLLLIVNIICQAIYWTYSLSIIESRRITSILSVREHECNWWWQGLTKR
jgi:hypothetical protein